MMEKKVYYIVEKNSLPEVFIKVMEVKCLMESGKSKTIQDAVAKVGISRSAFYKYRDSILPFYERTKNSTVTMFMTLSDIQGLLSAILNILAEEKMNVLTINQTMPLNQSTNLTISFEVTKDGKDLCELMDTIKDIEGVQTLQIIARE